MSTTNRAAVFAKAHKILRKHYTPVEPPERLVLEHLLYACCLEGTHFAAADKAFEQLRSGFFDWNEIRVSTVRELADTMRPLPDAERAAHRLKRALYAVFESSYSFDLEGLKKLNLGVAQQKLQNYQGVTHFAVAYLTQVTLGGHAIPLDRGSLECLNVLVGISSKERSEGVVAGLERAIPKNKGIEFASLLHQLGADMTANPMSTNLHKILLEIAPDCRERLPKRNAKPVHEPIKPAIQKSKFAERSADKAAAAKKASESAKAAKKSPPEAARPVAKKDSLKKDHPAAKVPTGKKSGSPPPKRKPK